MIGLAVLWALLVAPEATLRRPDAPAIVGVLLPVEVDVRGVGRAVPEGPRSGSSLGDFEVVGHATPERNDDGWTVRFTLLPTRPGDLVIPGFPVRLRLPGAREGRVRVAETEVRVASALAPGEAAVLRDDFVLEPFEEGGASAWWLAPWGLLVAFLAAWAVRRRGRAAAPPSRPRPRTEAAPAPDPTATALARLRALRDEVLASNGDRAGAQTCVADAADVLRRYLDARLDGRLLTRTTDELRPWLVRAAASVAVGGLLVDADLAKFAARAPTVDRVTAVLDGAIAWLEASPSRGGAP